MADALLDVNKEKEKTKWSEIKKKLYKSRQLYVFVIPALVVVAVFSYGPMYGVIIAFKDYIPSLGIFGSPWVGFPLPIILALALNELKDGKFKKFTQTVTYAPNFISVVVVCGMLIAFLTPSTGIINHLLVFLGFERISFMTDPRWFKTIYVLSGVWQGTGWGSVIYLAALSGVDTQLHEAATVDGATRWQRIWYINLPTIIPTMVILLIMNVGSLMSLGYEKILLMQNALNMDSSNVIATFVYKQGLLDAQYSYASAVGLFNAAINAFLLITVNKISRKVSETSL